MLPLQSLTYSIPYVIVFLILYIAVIPVSKKNIAFVNRVPQIQLLFLTLFFFIGLRGYISWDWKNYFSFWQSCPTLWNGFSNVSRFVINHHWEKGFVLYSILLKSISQSWGVFQSISFLIDFYVFYIFFRRYSPNYVSLAFCVWYVICGFIGLSFTVDLQRNVKSLLFFLISIRYIEQRNFKKYLVCNYIGSLFHISSILYIPLYFILKKKWKTKLVLGLFIVGNILFFLQIDWMIPVLRFVTNFIGGRLGSIAQYYVSSAFYSSRDTFSVGFIECYIIFVIIIIFKFRQKLDDKPIHTVLVNALYLQMFSYLYLSEMRVVMERIQLLFVFSNWILLSQLYSVLKKDYKSLFLILFLCYSLLKIWVNTRFVSFKYDNLLFQQLSIQERIELQQLLLRQLGR